MPTTVNRNYYYITVPYAPIDGEVKPLNDNKVDELTFMPIYLYLNYISTDRTGTYISNR